MLVPGSIAHLLPVQLCDCFLLFFPVVSFNIKLHVCTLYCTCNGASTFRPDDADAKAKAKARPFIYFSAHRQRNGPLACNQTNCCSDAPRPPSIHPPPYAVPLWMELNLVSIDRFKFRATQNKRIRNYATGSNLWKRRERSFSNKWKWRRRRGRRWWRIEEEEEEEDVHWSVKRPPKQRRR